MLGYINKMEMNMAHRSFSEYLDNKSKLQNTGKVQQIADYSGPVASKPGKEKKHKDAGGEGQVGEPKPYAGGTNAKDPNKGKLTDGFSGKGDKSLEYKPGKAGKSDKSGVPGGKVVASTWNKTKTQEWIDNTKDMSLSEFTKMLQKRTSKGLAEHTAPLDIMKQAAHLANANDSAMISLIQEMKRSKAFSKFMAEALQHDATYAVLAHYMEKDERYARRLVRAMNEMIAPPAHKGDLDMDTDPSKPPHPDDMHGTDDDNLDDNLVDDPEGLGDDEVPDGEEVPDDESDLSHDSDIAPGSKIMPQKKKKGHHHLMNALKDSPMGGDTGGLGQNTPSF